MVDLSPPVVKIKNTTVNKALANQNQAHVRTLECNEWLWWPGQWVYKLCSLQVYYIQQLTLGVAVWQGLQTGERLSHSWYPWWDLCLMNWPKRCSWWSLNLIKSYIILLSMLDIIINDNLKIWSITDISSNLQWSIINNTVIQSSCGSAQ